MTPSPVNQGLSLLMSIWIYFEGSVQLSMEKGPHAPGPLLYEYLHDPTKAQIKK